MKLDNIDIRILDILQKDGRISATRLAEMVFLSSSACNDRIKKLQNSGYIKGYGATLELKGEVELCTVVVEVTLQEHGAGMFRRFESEICKRPEVTECLHTAGGVNYVVKFVTAGIEKFQALLEELLEADIGIARYASYIVTKVVRENQGIPLAHLLQKDQTNDSEN